MKNKIRERWSHTDFYIGSLNTWATPVYQDNLSLIVHYIKSFTKSIKDYTFE